MKSVRSFPVPAAGPLGETATASAEAARSERRPVPLPRPLKSFLGLLIASAVCTLLDTALAYRHGNRTVVTYLWPPYPAFDFVDYTLQFPYRHTPVFFTLRQYPWYYPAPAIFVLYPFYALAAVTTRVVGFGFFVLTAVLFYLELLRRFGQALTSRGLRSGAAFALPAAVMVFSWPIYFGLQRGNIESLLWVGTAVGVLCWVRRYYAAAAVIFGLVGSVKLYPLLFLALLLPPRRFRDLVLGMVTAALSTLAGLRFLEPNIPYAWRQINTAVRSWSLHGTADSSTISFDHSIFGLYRLVAHPSGTQLPRALGIYLPFAASIAAALFLLRVWRMPRPNQLLFVACASIMLPPLSFDYTLVVILIPWGWFALLCVEDARLRYSPRRWFLLFALLGIVLAPLSFLHTHSPNNFLYAGPIRAVALLSLIFAAVVLPFPERFSSLTVETRQPQNVEG